MRVATAASATCCSGSEEATQASASARWRRRRTCAAQHRFTAGAPRFFCEFLRLTGPGSAAEHLLSNPQCAMAAVPDEDAPAFLTALTAAGAKAEGGELISGFNYSRGKQIAVRLYRITGN